MAFVNDYLTDKEKEVFKQRAIPTGLSWKGGMLGVDPYIKARCTLDREARIYLFNLGIYHDAENLDEENFRLVWDALAGDEAIHIVARMKFMSLSENDDERAVLWHLLDLGLPKNIKHEKEAVIAKFKEALTAFGVDGDPAWPVVNNSTFAHQ